VICQDRRLQIVTRKPAGCCCGWRSSHCWQRPRSVSRAEVATTLRRGRWRCCGTRQPPRYERKVAATFGCGIAEFCQGKLRISVLKRRSFCVTQQVNAGVDATLAAVASGAKDRTAAAFLYRLGGSSTQKRSICCQAGFETAEMAGTFLIYQDRCRAATGQQSPVFSNVAAGAMVDAATKHTPPRWEPRAAFGASD
jgi:hypothetical protein